MASWKSAIPAVIGFALPLMTASCSIAADDRSALEEAVEAHIEAIGGRSALESLGVIERRGEFVLEQNSAEYAGSYHTCVNYPDRVAIAIDAGPVQVHQVLGDHGALVCAAGFTACKAADEEVATELVETARVANREQLYMEFPAEPSEATESPDGLRFDYQLDGARRGIVFDQHTGRIRSLWKDARVRDLDDWRSIGDVMLPFAIRDRDAEGGTVTIFLTNVDSRETPSDWCKNAFASDAM